VQIDVRLDEIVLRALEQRPELRFQTAADFRTQLETISAGTGKTEVKSPKAEINPPGLLVPAVVLGLAYTALLVWLASSSLVLPERIAWHFDWHGNAVGWMSGRAEILLMAAVSLFLLALLWFTARSAVHFPRLLYIPRRDYWLAPERRELTSALLWQQLLWLATVLTISLGALHGMVVEANTHTPPRFEMAGLIFFLVIVFASVIICIVRLINRFAGATTAEFRTQVEAAVSAHGSSRREGASISSNPSRLIKAGFSALTTPEEFSTAAGQFLFYRTRGQLILDDHQLTHSHAGTNTVIPLTAIRDLSVGKMPRAVAPLGLELLSVTYEEGGQLKRLLLSPMVAWLAFPWTYNKHVAEWFTVIREAVTAATGTAPTRTPADQLDLPRSNPVILLMHGVSLVGLFLLGAALLTRPDGTVLKTVTVPGTVIVVNHSILFLIAFVGGGCLSFLIIRGVWRAVINRTRSGWLRVLAIAGPVMLVVFAVLIAYMASQAQRARDEGQRAIMAAARAEVEARAGLQRATAPAIQPALAAWQQGDKDGTVRNFLAADWRAGPIFAPESMLSLTESEYLSQMQPVPGFNVTRDMEAKGEQMLKELRTMKELVAAVTQAGREAAATNNTALARKHFYSLQRFGAALDHHQSLSVLRLEGRAIKKKAGVELQQLVTRPSNEMEVKLAAAVLGAVSKVQTDRRSATIAAQVDAGEELLVFIGDESLGWASSSPKWGEVRATVEASNELRLDGGSLGQGFVIRTFGTTSSSTANVAIAPGGPVPFGTLVFRANDAVSSKDGIFTFADIHQPDGTLVPVSVRVRKGQSHAK
jgi:hypothetical protein